MTASLGNKDLLKLRKTAFLCSRVLPASTVLKCYDWAIDTRILLMPDPFENSVRRVTLETAAQRNRFMIEPADEIVIGYANPGVMPAKLLAEVKEKKVTRIQE